MKINLNYTVWAKLGLLFLYGKRQAGYDCYNSFNNNNNNNNNNKLLNTQNTVCSIQLIFNSNLVWFQTQTYNFSLLQTCSQATKHIQRPIQRLKLLNSYADLSPPSNIKFRLCGSIPPHVHVSSWHGVYCENVIASLDKSYCAGGNNSLVETIKYLIKNYILININNFTYWFLTLCNIFWRLSEYKQHVNNEQNCENDSQNQIVSCHCLRL
jgi:hypothetical protein